MSEKLVSITGANQGIGYHAAQQLAATGKFKIDVHYDGSIKAAAEAVEAKYGRLDIRVNKAGILGLELPSQGASLREQYLEVYNTNVFGQAVCTEMFEPLLRKSNIAGGKRIIFTSSGLGSLTVASDPNSVFPGKSYPVPVYRSSRTAENMLGVHYAAMLEDEGSCVCVVCPGYCEPNLNGYTRIKDPADGAKAILSAAEGKAEDIHSRFLHTEIDDGRYPW